MSRLAGPRTDSTVDRPVRDGARRFWGVVVPIVFTIGLVWFVWIERDALRPAWEAPPAALALITLLIVGGHFLNSTEFWLLYRATGTRLGIFENWMVFTAGQLANHLPAQAGTLYRFRYMRTVHDLSHMRNAAVHGANLVVTLGGAALVGLLGVIGTAAFTGAGLEVLVLLVFAGVALVALLFAVVPLPPFRGRAGRLASFWREFHAGFEEIRRLPGTAVTVLALEGLKYLVTAWRFQVAFSLIAIHQPYWIFLVIAPAAGVAGFIAVTPAALGFREAFVTGAAASMGVEVTGGLLGATVDRAVLLAVSVIFGGVGLLLTYPRMRGGSRCGETSNHRERGSM